MHQQWQINPEFWMTMIWKNCKNDNEYKIILEKKLEQQENLGCFLYIQVELNK